jgi:D-lactate dehydrogenase
MCQLLCMMFVVILCVQGLGMDVLAYDVRQNPAVEAMGIPYHDLDYILPRADIISLHVPLLPATYHLINKDRCGTH